MERASIRLCPALSPQPSRLLVTDSVSLVYVAVGPSVHCAAAPCFAFAASDAAVLRTRLGRWKPSAEVVAEASLYFVYSERTYASGPVTAPILGHVAGSTTVVRRRDRASVGIGLGTGTDSRSMAVVVPAEKIPPVRLALR